MQWEMMTQQVLPPLQGFGSSVVIIITTPNIDLGVFNFHWTP